MALDSLFGTTIQLLAKNIDLRSKNHGHIAGNIANAETPQYRAKTFSFEKQLQDVLQGDDGRSVTPVQTHPRHIPLTGSAGSIAQVEGVLEDAPARGTGKDGNSVDLEREMGRMAENQILYNASIQVLARKFEGLKNVLKGGN